ncbi:hypothetical protein FJZ31_05020 [Candidatus Poribacteria bacterium]|nr:hypothetical protein [Candidatus Poribacteria bacterium]
MPILEDLPKEIPEGKFEEFLQKIEQDFPEDEFPEIFVKYYTTDKKVIILDLLWYCLFQEHQNGSFR